MKSNGFDKMTVKQLTALRTKIDGALAEAKEREKAAVIAKAQKLAEDSGFDLKELFAAKRKKWTRKPAKYTNPADRRQRWDGTGTPPRWFSKRIAAKSAAA